ncbi:alpha-amylase family glycosyl hydrolase [Halomicroarcula sp. GCM10025709]|uniref:alpha-amylase family glycosyl hydrolase n=1 Tax=Halomicroarcula sp. GCM10025709 TaxID=3252669 RepID=UPI0036244EAB
MSDHDDPPTRRRFLLSAALASLAGCPGRPSDSSADDPTASATPAPGTGSPTGVPDLDAPPQAAIDGSHAPGPPVFTSVGASVRAPEFAGVESNLAPRNPDPTAGYDWSVVDAPAGSEAAVGDGFAVQFQPDVPGTYALELRAPDGVHRQTVRAFPERTAGDPRPTLSLDGDVADGTAEIRADVRPPTDSDAAPGDLTVEFLVDDRDSFEGNISVDGHTARLPLDAMDGPVRVHAAAAGETGRSVADTLVVDPDARELRHPTEPPEWASDAVVYEVFVRRFGADVDFTFLESKVEYIDSMGADAVWLTPILDAHSHRDESQPGGPHGYDVVDYFEPADALGDRAAFESFVDACHDRGIKVIFDLVGNHTARQHRYFRAAKAAVTDTAVSNSFAEWYRWTDEQALYYFGWRGIPALNYDTLAVRSWFLAIVAEWADVVDGFRCDVAWGMPHSLWKEVRERVKRDHPEFLLLGEAVPWDADHADFAENEFGLHYAEGLFRTLQAVGRGEAPADDLQNVVAERRDAGYPAHVGLLNYVENHDTDRFLSFADRRCQRAAGAATFTLPGAPLLYYGQETGLTEPRERMNWDEADRELRSFYRSLAELRHDLTPLQSDADVVPLSVAPGDDRVTGYAREADGERVHVLLNFGDGPTTVAQHPAVGRTDLVSGESVTAGEGVTVEAAVVLRADALSGRGAPRATFSDPAGDATPPAGRPAGEYDLTGMAVHESDDGLQFAWRLSSLPADGGPTVEAYLRDPTADGGSGETRGVGATLAAPAQHRVVATTEGATVERVDGTTVADLPTRRAGSELVVEVPSRVVPDDPNELAFTTLLRGDGAAGDGTAIADLLVGPVDDESSIRAADRPVLPMVPLAAGVRNRLLDAERVAAWTDPAGDDHGPGGFTYPETERWEPGSLDLRRVAVFEGADRYHWQFEFAEPVPDGVDRSRLAQHLQVYVRDPDTDGGRRPRGPASVADWPPHTSADSSSTNRRQRSNAPTGRPSATQSPSPPATGWTGSG